MERLDYADLVLKIERSDARYTAQVLSSPGGEATGGFSLPFSRDRLELLVFRIGHARARVRSIQTEETEAARELGGKLFESVFAGEVLACLRRSLDIATQSGKNLRLKLRLQDVGELADIPWEFLFDTGFKRFIALSNQTPIVRYVELPERIPPLKTSLPLELLIMISSPRDYEALDVGHERASIEEALGSLIKTEKIRIHWMEQATLASLRRCMRDGSYHIFHFIGHGGFDAQLEEGKLVLEGEDRFGYMASADQIGTILHDHRSLRLVFLNSCEGARNSRADPFAGVAATLIRQGIPAVVAMQFEITDTAAITFSKEFYAAIATGFPVDAAVAEGRKSIFSMPNDVEWGTPVLYSRAPDGMLFDMQEQEELGRIEVSSDPPGAIIYLDGIAKGKTPTSILASDGEHNIKATLEGYREYSTAKYLRAGRVDTLHAILQLAEAVWKWCPYCGAKNDRNLIQCPTCGKNLRVPPRLRKLE